MAETRELLKYNGRSLVEIKIDGVIKKYVVCRNYDPTKEYGNQWDTGSYFDVWGNTTAENMCRTATLFLYGIKETKPIVPYERIEEIATKTIGKLVDDVCEEDVVEFLKEKLEMTEVEAEMFDVKDILYPKKYDIVEVTLERTQKTVLKVVVPSGIDTTYDIEDYMDGYDYVEADDEGDWEIYEAETYREGLNKEEVKDRYSVEDIWNYETLDDM